MKDKMDKWVKKARTAIKWVAVDSNGAVYGFTKEPRACSTIWHNEKGSDVHVFLGVSSDEELKKNWDKTLRKVEYGK